MLERLPDMLLVRLLGRDALDAFRASLRDDAALKDATPDERRAAYAAGLAALFAANEATVAANLQALRDRVNPFERRLMRGEVTPEELFARTRAELDAVDASARRAATARAQSAGTRAAAAITTPATGKPAKT